MPNDMVGTMIGAGSSGDEFRKSAVLENGVPESWTNHAGAMISGNAVLDRAGRMMERLRYRSGQNLPADNEEKTVPEVAELLKIRPAVVRAICALCRSMPAMMQVFDGRGQIFDVSDAWLDLMGYRREEVVGQSIISYIDASARDQVQRGIIVALHRSQRCENMPLRLVSRLGDIIEVSFSASPDLGLECPIPLHIGVMHPMGLAPATDPWAAHGHGQAVITMLGGLAHSFNNILQVIQSSLELAYDGERWTDDAPSLLNTASDAVERGAAITHQLMSYSLQQFLRPQRLSLNHLLRELIPAWATSKLGAGIVTDIPREEFQVSADREFLHAALGNLVVNAAEATCSNQGIRVHLERRRAVEPLPDHHDYAVIQVSDCGSGIHPALLPYVCLPFISTKSKFGAGLGLAMVQGFARQSGGELFINSVAGEGTTVELWLPLLAAHTVQTREWAEASA